MENRKNILSLTGLKGLFILPIIWFHTAPGTPLFSQIPAGDFFEVYGGSLGNAMFFILSGFLLTWGYRDRIIRKEVSFPDYLGRRLGVLYPSCVLSTLSVIVLCILKNGFSDVNLSRIVMDLLLQSGGGLVGIEPYNAPLWFASALVVCYIAFYFLASHAGNPVHYRIGLGVGIAWGYALLILRWDLPFCRSNNGVAFLNFFLGCILAEGYPCLSRKIHRLAKPVAFLVLGGSFWLLLCYGVETIAGNITIAFSFVLCPLILYLAVQSRIFRRVLESRPVLWLGKVSMSLFFWHCVLKEWYQYLLGCFHIEMTDGLYLLYLAVLLLWCYIPVPKWQRRPAVRETV